MTDELAIHADDGLTIDKDLGSVLRSQKDELVGQLAGAMANQFNNIMMAITSCTELELKKASPPQKRNLEQILSHSARATSLIQKLLDFSRKHHSASRKFSFNPVIKEICGLLQPLMGEEVEICLKLDSTVGTVMADPVEIEQLTLSLGLNARDTANQGGRLEVSTELIDLDPKTFGDELSQPGKFAVLSLHYACTSGTTVSHNPQPVGHQDLRITQAIAAARSIMKERRGFFRVSTRPGQSTTFRVYFPALPSVDVPSTPEPLPGSTAASTKTILIVEDDDAVRNPAAEFLKMEGFKVLQARTGPEALRIVQDSRSRLDLLVTDIVMVGMHGDEVADQLHASHPGLKVLYMSGDADKASRAAKRETNRPHAVLQKPFRLNKLNDKIRELLGD